MRNRFGVFVYLLALAGPAQATTMMPVERTCPVGGAKYESFEITSTSSFGVRLDLRTVGPAGFIPYIECPNGFVVYKPEEDFTPAEIETLTSVVASEAFQDARKNEPTAARIVMQRRALGDDEAALRHLYLVAAFEAEDSQNEQMRQRFLSLAASAYNAFLGSHSVRDEEWWVAQIRAAEIARQQGRFADAIRIADNLASVTPPGEGWLGGVARQIKAKAEAGDAAPATAE